MAEFIDCNYEENLVSKFERISAEFFSTEVNLEDDAELLKESTQVLNEEILNFRRSRNDLLKTNRINPSLKNEIGKRFVSARLKSQYDRANISSVQNLIDFVNKNRESFREVFPSENRIISTIVSIDPQNFRTFDIEYPNISNRIRAGQISSAEVSSLVEENGFDLRQLLEKLKTNIRNILNLLERFLSRLGIGVEIMGAFCAIVKDVYALTRGQRDLTGNPSQFSRNFNNILELNIPGQNVTVLQTLDQQLSNVIDQSVEQLRSRLSAFTPESLDNGFHFNMTSSYGRMTGLIATAQNASSEDTTEAMKDSVKGMIAQSSEKYRQRDKEEVEFVALRFCKLAGEIERIYRDVTTPLEEMTRSFQTSDRSLSASGNETTLRAIRAGAIRYDTQTRLEAMERSGSIPATIANAFINAAGLRTNIPPQGTFPTDSQPPVPGDFIFPSYEAALRGEGGIKYAGPTVGSARQIVGRAGFTVRQRGSANGVDPNAMARLYMLARRWGQVITVSSAFRNPEANGFARTNRRGVFDSGGYHVSGQAFDCLITGRSNQIRFMNLAYQVGFRGIGAYPGFVHIDTRGNPTSWGTFRYYNLPGPAGTKIG